MTTHYFIGLTSDSTSSLTILRNIKGFMIQGGDPTGTGKGGESIWGHPLRDEFSLEHRHDRRGMLSMANNGPDTGGAQFFFTYSAQPHLNNKYSIFGK
jgi:peptidyl-prolyl cis-trans isomerase-like 3